MCGNDSGARKTVRWSSGNHETLYYMSWHTWFAVAEIFCLELDVLTDGPTAWHILPELKRNPTGLDNAGVQISVSLACAPERECFLASSFVTCGGRCLIGQTVQKKKSAQSSNQVQRGNSGYPLLKVQFSYLALKAGIRLKIVRNNHCGIGVHCSHRVKNIQEYAMYFMSP